MHFKNFDINLFVVFDQLWRTRSVSEAADVLCVSQPTVSSALKKLRDYFSDQLFVWVGGVMKPTPKAEVLIVEIREVLERTGSILDQTRFDPKSAKRSISLSTADYLIGAIGPSLLESSAAEAPQLRLDFTSFEMQMAFAKGTQAADMYIFPNSAVANTHYSHKIVHRDKYVLIACQSNNLIGDQLSADQFFEMPKVAFSATPHTVDNHEFSWFPQARELGLRVLLPNYGLIPLFVRNTPNIAVVPLTLLRVIGLLSHTEVARSPFKIFMPPVEIPDIEAGLYWDPVYEHDALHSWLRGNIEEAAAASDNENKAILNDIL